MKYLIILLLLNFSCNKPPIKKCYTVINVKIISFTPDVYRVTFASGMDTVKITTSSLYTLGYNTCTGYGFNTQLLKP